LAETDDGTLEKREDAGSGDAGLVRLWLKAIALAEKDEEKWRKTADQTSERFRDEKDRKGARFNILFASTMTLCPALYNSTPTPDVRRRFLDDDPLGKAVSQVLERGLSYTSECGDLDGAMVSSVFDSVLIGRGVTRVRYVPKQDEAGEVAYEEVTYEHVDWRDFRHGPGKRWDDVPWVAFRHRITRDQAIKLNPKVGATVSLDYCQEGSDKDGEPHDIFKRLTVWEIWDKDQREVLFIAPSHKEAPLGKDAPFCNFRGFFPIPRPLYDIDDTNSLTPIVPYTIYRDQAEELDRITSRISSLIKVLRWRGFRGAIEEFGKLADADDGEMVPISNWQQYVSQGGLDKAIWLMPIKELGEVIAGLYVQRDQLKQTIFELTGVADVMRGQTDSNETLGAQQLKAQWGSIRLQARQKEVSRYSRDLMFIAAEIISEKFSPDTLRLMTGIELPSLQDKQQAQMAMQQAQATGQPPPKELESVLSNPSWEEVIQTLQNDGVRGFKIDIETDSTIEADQMRAQKNMGDFTQGFSTFITAVGPAVEAGAMPMDVAADLLASFARRFKLGRSAENALDRLSKVALQPKPPKEDPKAADAKLKAEAEQQKLGFEQQKHGEMMQFEREKHQQLMAQNAEQAAFERQRQADHMQFDRERAGQEMQFKAGQALIDRERADKEIEFKTSQADNDRNLRVQELGIDPDEPKKLDQIAEGLGAALSQIGAALGQIAEQNAQIIEQTAKKPNGLTVAARDQQGRISKVTVN